MANSKLKSNQVGIDGDTVDNVVFLDPNEVFVPENRFRKLSVKAVDSIAESMEKHGQLQIIRVDKNGNLIDGNHRLHACIKLGLRVKAEVIDCFDENLLALQEIDTNLIRNELTPTEKELHLAERKRLYIELYPDTAKGKATKDTDQKSFVEDTADKMGVSKKTVERTVKRGELAGKELQEARDNKEISTADIDDIIKETGGDKQAQKVSLQEKLKAKREAKQAKIDEKNNEEEVVAPESVLNLPLQTVSVQQDEIQELKKQLAEREDTIKTLTEQRAKDIEALEFTLAKKDKSIKNYRERIAKAQTKVNEAGMEIKI